MQTYATADDLVSPVTPWLDDVPDDVGGLLRQASTLVAVAAGRNPYTDPAPAGNDVDALRDATCAQVTAWVRGGVDPSGGSAAAALPKRTEIFEAKVEYDTTTQAAARAQAVTELAAEAVAILRVAGLLLESLPLFDASGALPSWGLDSLSSYLSPARAEWPFA